MRITGISGLHAVQSPTEENSKRVVGGASRLFLKERAREALIQMIPAGALTPALLVIVFTLSESNTSWIRLE